ncbi:POT family protein [Hirsutella rhossiliensis]|uniref:POT family domain-containing protein n=1 Tax=Hirsutella rhossiliensis TaxID=111463 RepID=A0A9P8MWV7_9HYPO|nr:POT family domain-containing protein [Hirsutella rhossiliensis]KAH0961874.1 POT family domain-containing protein [Hirsutella rhossiliensis]
MTTVEVELDHLGASQVKLQCPAKVSTPQLSSGFSAEDSSDRENDAEAGTGDDDSYRPPNALAGSPDVKRVPYPITRAGWIVIVMGSLERMAFYGGSTPFQNYIQRSGSPGHPGRLGKGQVAATALNQYFFFLSYLTPVMASAICDSVSGKYGVILASSIAGIAGWGLIAGTSVQSVAVEGALAGLVVGMAAVAARGTGMTVASPSNPTLRGRLIVYDSSLNVSHIFHWYYLYINAIGLVGSLATPFIEIYSTYPVVFLFATGSMALGTAVLVLGKSTFKMVKPQQGLVSDCVKSVRISLAERKRSRSGGLACGHFLDRSKASYQTALYGANSSGVADQTVEDLKRALDTLRILPPLAVFWLAFNQCSHNLLSQASQMRRPSWLSNDLMTNANPIALTVFVPVLDHYGFPWLRKKGWEPTPIKRMTFGFLLASLGMVYAAVLQAFIYRAGPYFDHPGDRSNNISVWWQLPPYTIVALAEIFAVITALEYAYSRSPASMKTFVSAMNAVPNAVASLLVYALLPLNRDPYLTWNFATIALLAFTTTIVFWWLFRKEDREWKSEADDKHRDALNL